MEKVGKEKPRIAICQPIIILGGRLQVILGIVEILNEAGVIPTIFTNQIRFRPEDIPEKYGRSFQVEYRFLPYIRVPRLSLDFSTILFNTMLKYYAADFDLLINTSNSLIFLPEKKDVITYMFYPRKGRIMANVPNIHQPDLKRSSWSLSEMQKTVLRRIYRLSRPKPGHKIVCMTKFTCLALNQMYNDLPEEMPLIYPPVDTNKFDTNCSDRLPAVVTIGRFGPDKRQLEQIKLAERLPNIRFYLVGFVGNRAYYQYCKQYVESRNLRNVSLHPDAPFDKMNPLLQESKYFLHTLINEPFGITAVQAIAAGCIPIVHDSGGQRETVPDPRLRYQTLEEIPKILEFLETLDLPAVDLLRSRLQQHIRSFDKMMFHQQMKEVLAPYLDTNNLSG